MKDQIKYVLRFLKGSGWLYFFAIAAVLFSTLFAFVPPLIIRGTIDSIIGNEVMDASSIEGIVFKTFGGKEFLSNNLWISGALLVVFSLFSGIFIFLQGRWTAMASEGIAKKFRDELYDHIQKLPFLYHSKSSVGDLIQRCTSDVNTIRRFLSFQLIEVARAIIMLAGVLPIMIRLNVKMTIVSMFSVPFLFAFSYIFFLKIKKLFKDSDEAEGYLSNVLQENLSGVRVVKAFARQSFEIEMFDQKNDDYRDKTYKLIKVLAVYWSSTDLISLLQISGVMIFGVVLASRGEISVGTFVAFLTYEGTLLWPIRQMGRILTDMGKATVSMKRIQEILDEKPEEYQESKSNRPEIKGKIEFQNVSFEYDQDSPVLKNVSFEIEPGQTLAIFGSTGSGKSTLINLLIRLFDYSDGKILIDGVELKTIDKEWIRENISLLLQEPFLYSKSIKENIAIGNLKASEKDIFDATKTAFIHRDIKSFDKGYETLVGEKGVTLSGGQKQRVSIARTILKRAPILVFDDSLSAVDTQTDARIRNKLSERTNKVTTIIISHRLNSFVNADKILVMNEGEIIEIGNHQELLKLDGFYAKVWKAQNTF